MTVVGRSQTGAAVADIDFAQGFDHLCLKFCWKVLKKKGVSEGVISRLKRLYQHGTTRVSVNDIIGEPIKNLYQSLRQGDLTSMLFFVISMDPLLKSLKRLLKGIVIRKVIVAGPAEKGKKGPVYLEELYVVVGYADDLKPAITSTKEVEIVVNQCTKLELASGVKLHRSPESGKCKLLPIGKWASTLTQQDIPYNFIKLSDTLNVMGVKICANYRLTRVKNAEIITEKVKNITNLWRSG